MCPKSAQTVSKCRDDEDQMSKIANLSKTANDVLGWHFLALHFQKISSNNTKYGFLDSRYILF